MFNVSRSVRMASFVGVSLLCSSTIALADSWTRGVLVLAHGTQMGGHGGEAHNRATRTAGAHDGHTDDHGTAADSPGRWEAAVLDLIPQLHGLDGVPVEVAFGMWNNMSFQAGIERLKAQVAPRPLDELIVVPLFISSYSLVMEAQQYMFHQRDTLPPELEGMPMPIAPVDFDGVIQYLPAIDYHPAVSQIVVSRAHALVEHGAHTHGIPAKADSMEIILTMHGPVRDADNERWLEMGRRYADEIQDQVGVAAVHVISLRDDAPDPIRSQATADLRAVVEKAHLKQRLPLVLPLLISPGGIEAGILERLDGLDYVWNGEVLLPDPRMADYLSQTIVQAISPPKAGSGAPQDLKADASYRITGSDHQTGCSVAAGAHASPRAGELLPLLMVLLGFCLLRSRRRH